MTDRTATDTIKGYFYRLSIIIMVILNLDNQS